MKAQFSRRQFLTTMGAGAIITTGGMLTGIQSAQAQAADVLADIKKRGFMRVGAFSVPPESWVDVASGEWKGVDADFTLAIAKQIGVQVDPIILTHSAFAPSLDSQRVDVIAMLYRTPEREKVVAYNERPTWYGIDVLVARKNDSIKKTADLKGKVIGTVRGSAQELEAAAIQKKFATGDIRKYDTADPMLMDLKAGRIDGAIWWGYTFDYAQRQNPDYDFAVLEALAPSYLGSDTLPANYYVFSKNGTANLIKAFDDGIEKIIAAGDSKKILAKYGMTNPSYLTGKFG
ncbi:hypothetical protein W822_14530 [Advenella kashmirensis W13003]|uniref:Solute-binding protein family 3/N-terminal domain-containing protein n=1 Tax=Advenella kashmirensis W13003 TaxID=1424334 RepID=V8QSR5_9BURK|nr:transporter substrate-binding domain-containing protein [Advenella kashmirensis]ETF02383.1 hypothetical protein W822_14530 [Advenella kashmirensis W13003]